MSLSRIFKNPSESEEASEKKIRIVKNLKESLRIQIYLIRIPKNPRESKDISQESLSIVKHLLRIPESPKNLQKSLKNRQKSSKKIHS